MYRYQLENFIRTGERPPNVTVPADGLIWRNTNGFPRRPVLAYLYGDQFPEYVTTIRGWEGRAGFGQYHTGADDYWFATEESALAYIEDVFLPELRSAPRWFPDWNAKEVTMRPRPPEPAHRKGFPSLVETARFIIGLPPTARREEPFQSCLDTAPPTDLVDPVTGLVPVFLVLRRRGEEA